MAFYVLNARESNAPSGDIQKTTMLQYNFFIPCRWSPEWLEVQLLVYEGQLPLFSILWSDLGYPSRHMMDFTPAELPGFNTGAAPEAGGALGNA